MFMLSAALLDIDHGTSKEEEDPVVHKDEDAVAKVLENKDILVKIMDFLVPVVVLPTSVIVTLRLCLVSKIFQQAFLQTLQGRKMKFVWGSKHALELLQWTVHRGVKIVNLYARTNDKEWWESGHLESDHFLQWVFGRKFMFPDLDDDARSVSAAIHATQVSWSSLTDLTLKMYYPGSQRGRFRYLPPDYPELHHPHQLNYSIFAQASQLENLCLHTNATGYRYGDLLALESLKSVDIKCFNMEDAIRDIQRLPNLESLTVGDVKDKLNRGPAVPLPIISVNSPTLKVLNVVFLQGPGVELNCPSLEKLLCGGLHTIGGVRMNTLFPDAADFNLVDVEELCDNGFVQSLCVYSNEVPQAVRDAIQVGEDCCIQVPVDLFMMGAQG